MVKRNVIVVRILLAASIVLLAACGSVGLTEDERFERAQAHERSGDLRSADIELRNLLQQNPNHAEGRLALAMVALERGDLSTARMELERAQSLGLDPAALRIPIARVAIATGDHAQVLDALNLDELSNHPIDEQAQALVLRGEALAALDVLDQAAEAFGQARELRPDYAPAYVGIASVQRARGDSEAARESLQTALDLDPGSYQAWHLLGEMHRAEGRLEDAESAYGEALEHAPVPYIFHLKRALTRMALQDLDGMEQDLKAMKRHGPKHPATAYVEGLMNFQNQEFADAQTSFQESLSRTPDFQPAVFFLGATHLAREQWGQAEVHLQNYLRAHPDSTDAARLLAQARLGQGDLERAESLLQGVLGRNPDDVLALNLMGNVYLARGEHSEGIGQLRRVAALRPSDPGTQIALALSLIEAGEGSEGLTELRSALDDVDPSLEMEASYVLALIRQGQYGEAVTAADLLAERWPSSALPHNLKAGALVAMEDQSAAQEALQNALRAEPGNPAASVNLGQLLAIQGDGQAAKRVYRESLQQNPGHPEISLRLGQLLQEEQAFEAAREVLEEAIQIHPEQRNLRLTLARQHLERNEYRLALAVLEPIQQAAENDVQTLTLLARAQIGAGQRTRGVETLRKVSRRAQDTVTNRLRLGAAFETAGSATDARGEYRRALELQPGNAEALERQALLEMREGRTGEALELARTLQRDASAGAIGFTIEGHLHALAERPEEAARAFAAAYEREPSSARAALLARSYRQAGREEDAVSVLRNRLERHPDDDEARFRLAEILRALGENPEAIEHYEELVRMYPENLLVLNNLAYLYQAVGDERALEIAERAYAQGADVPEVSATLGWILVNRDDTQRGLPLLEAARNALEDRPEVRYRFAFALAKAGRTEEARQELTALLDQVGRDGREREKAEDLLEALR